MAVSTTLAGEVEAKPRRIISMNLCTDQLLLQLVDRERIASVTHLAADPAISHFSRKARDIPVNHGLAEEILPLKPDLILAGALTTRPTTELLKRLGYRVTVLAAADGFAAVRRNIRTIARTVGEEAMAARLIEDFDAALAALDNTGPRPSAIVLWPRGVTTGRKSLVNEILGAAGFRNLAADLGVTGMGRLTLEQIIEARPDLLVMGEAHPGRPSLGHLVMRHPALAAMRGPHGMLPGRVDLPTHLWNCGGVQALRAIAILKEARTALLRRRRDQ